MSDEDQDGFTRPPRHSQFKPGQSGNPKGRPKGTRNLKTDLTRLMRKRVQIREDGHQRDVSRQELVLLRLFERAAKGDVKAANSLINMVMKLNPQTEQLSAVSQVSETDKQIIDDFLRRYVNASRS